MLMEFRKWIGATPQVSSLRDFGEFLAEQAVFAAQKTVMAYCEVKAGNNRDTLFAEPEFRAALERCRWESAAAVLADLLVLAYRFLRDHADGRDAELTAELARLYPVLLDRQGRPAHRPEGWNDVTAPFPARLEQARLQGVAGPADVARAAARRIHEVLPIHEVHRRTDREAIDGAVRFHTVAVWDEMVRRVDAAAVARDFLRV